MAQYISKSDLLAEIERLEKKNSKSEYVYDSLDTEYTLKSIRSFLNTLEVKEVDLEKESELIANGIMISVQSNKYGTNIYNTERNDFNHHHLQMAARKGIEFGLNAKENNMTREEERKQRAKEIFDIPYSQAIFMCDAEGADKTMIEKACEWLQNHTMKELCMKEEDSVIVQEFIESFKKAIEE